LLTDTKFSLIPFGSFIPTLRVDRGLPGGDALQRDWKRRRPVRRCMHRSLVCPREYCGVQNSRDTHTISATSCSTWFTMSSSTIFLTKPNSWSSY